MRASLFLLLLFPAFAGCLAEDGLEENVVRGVGGDNNAFKPPTIAVEAGGGVTWKIESGHHTVTFAEPLDEGEEAPDSGDLAPGAEYVLSFPVAGTYQYRCIYHSSDFGAGKGMTGTVTVT